MPSRFAIAAGPNVALSCLICAASILTGPASILASGFGLGDALALARSMISRSQVATPSLAAHGQDHQADAALR
jgi:hypothetical protein